MLGCTDAQINAAALVANRSRFSAAAERPDAPSVIFVNVFALETSYEHCDTTFYVI